MGVDKAVGIQQNLLAAGMGGDTAVAVIERASRADERVTIGSLATLQHIINKREIESPATIIIGEVVKLGAASNESAQAEYSRTLALA